MIPVTPTINPLFGASLGQHTATTTGATAGLGPGPTPILSGSSIDRGAAGSVPFGDLMTDAIGQVDGLESKARSTVEGLMAGTGVDVHEAMIATEKAQMGFELVLSIRNKALASYQQIMGMQF